MGINFKAMSAFKYLCPVCLQSYIGGHNSEDPTSEAWLKQHNDWHTAGNKGPPANLPHVLGGPRLITP